MEFEDKESYTNDDFETDVEWLVGYGMNKDVAIKVIKKLLECDMYE